MRRHSLKSLHARTRHDHLFFLLRDRSAGSYHLGALTFGVFAGACCLLFNGGFTFDRLFQCLDLLLPSRHVLIGDAHGSFLLGNQIEISEQFSQLTLIDS